MVKCKDCIFAKPKSSDGCECFNPHSDEFSTILFTEWDGCVWGKKSTVGIDEIQRIMLMAMNREE